MDIIGFEDCHYNKPKKMLYLDDTKKSWVKITYLKKRDTDTLNFEKIWDTRPENDSFVKIMGKNIKVPRKQQQFSDEGKDYYFSGTNSKSEPVPECIKRYLNISKKMCDIDFNGVLVNWYSDGSDYIGLHSDSEKGLVYDNSNFKDTDSKKGIVVWSLTLYSIQKSEQTNKRIFRIKKKSGGKDRIDITLDQKSVLIMGGDMQKHYTHSVPKTKKNVPKRINITCRLFH